MKPEEFKALIELEPQWRAEIESQWTRLMALAVWGDLKCANIGALPKLRKRVLDLGEKWRSLFNDRSWIPHPRERLKNILGSALSLRDSLQATERATQDLIGGADLAQFNAVFAHLRRAIVEDIAQREHAWATALDSINKDAADQD